MQCVLIKDSDAVRTTKQIAGMGGPPLEWVGQGGPMTMWKKLME